VFAACEQFSGASWVAGWGVDLVNLHPPAHSLTHTTTCADGQWSRPSSPQFFHL